MSGVARLAVAVSFALLVVTGTAYGQGRPETSGQDFPDSVVAEIPVGGDPIDVAVLPNAQYLHVANQLFNYYGEH